MNPNPNPKPDIEITDAFRKAFLSGGGGIRMKCEFCGRECFENDPHQDWNPGEWDDLQQKAKEAPDGFIPMERCIGIQVSGKVGVDGCPCGFLAKHEAFVWSHRNQIMEYLSERVKENAEQALKEEALAEHAQDALEQQEKLEEEVDCPKCNRKIKRWQTDEFGMCYRCGVKEQQAERIVEILKEIKVKCPNCERRVEPRDLRDNGEKCKECYDDGDNLPF